MAVLPRERLAGCDGYRVESPQGVLGRVEETWLGPDGEPSALTVRVPDGQRRLLLEADVETVADGYETVAVRPGARLLELDAARMKGLASAEPAATRGERPIWQVALLLYAGIVVLILLFTAAAFAVAAALS